MRKFWYCFMIICLIVSFVVFSACSDDSSAAGGGSSSVSDAVSSTDSSASGSVSSAGTASSGAASSAYSGGMTNRKIKIGSFNIFVFGTGNLDKPNKMRILAQVATNFDILAVQEVGSNGDPSEEGATQVMEAYVARINQLMGGTPYAYVRAHQYAFVYKTNSIDMQGHHWYNGSQSFRYKPLVAKFSVRNGNFKFVLVTIHTSPRLAETEIPALQTVMQEASAQYGESDVAALGDYNGDGSYYAAGAPGGDLAGWSNPPYTTVVKNGSDTTVAANNYTYDRFQLSQTMAEDYAGTYGVFRFAEHYDDINLVEGSPSQAGTERALSDHYPIWGEFWADHDTD